MTDMILPFFSTEWTALLLPEHVTWAAALALIVISFFTSALTAAFGIGGGMVMVGALSAAIPPATIIAVHAVVQLGSNFGRAMVQRQHAVWRLVWLFFAGSVIGITIGATLVTALPVRLLLGLLGVFILAMVWLPTPSIPGLARSGMFLGGIVSSILTMFVGATGVFSKAILLAYGLERKQLIATDAMAMSIQHALKIIAFGILGFSFADWWPLLVAMIASGFAGTLVGTALLNRLPEVWFKVIIKTFLTLIALDLVRRAAFQG
jgi:uncharacterized protein